MGFIFSKPGIESLSDSRKKGWAVQREKYYFLWYDPALIVNYFSLLHYLYNPKINLLFTFNTVHYRNVIFINTSQHWESNARTHARTHPNLILIAHLNPHSRYISWRLGKIFGSHSEFQGKTKIIDKFQIWHNTLYSEKCVINKILKIPYIFKKFQLKQFFLYF